MTIPTSAAPLLEQLVELNGEIIFLLGNHNDTVQKRLNRIQFFEEFRFEHCGVPFHAVYDPAEALSNWKGWLLHTHYHNSYPDRFFFVDQETGFINFSVELIDYRPLVTDRIAEYLTRGERLIHRTATKNGLKVHD